MYIRGLLVPAVLAAAFLPAVPSHAVATRPCGTGYVGVVVYDDSGDIANVCVRTGDVTGPVGEVVGIVKDVEGQLVAKVQPYVDWVRNLHCVYYPDSGVIRCDAPPRG